jgi:hypothetical protein
MVLAGADRLTQDSLTFWTTHLGEVPDDLRVWLRERVEEAQVHWQNVGWLVRSQRMLQELTEQLDARDPTNAWTRQYERIYFESQVMALTRMASSSRWRGSRTTSLTLLLDEFRNRPELLGPLAAGPRTPDELLEPADPAADQIELKRLIKPIMPWRNKAIAHLEMDVPLPDLAWSQLDDAIGGVVDVFWRYSLRLTGVRYQVDHEGPPWQNWQKVFMQPHFVETDES